ncbi:MAG: T9SS type A sorting domain-containing protein [Rhodothermales bacterium]
MKTCILLLSLLLLAEHPALAQTTITIANSRVSLHNGAELATSGHLTIAGTFTPNDGTLVFDGAGNQRLTSGTAQTLAHLTVNKPSGDLVLENHLTVTGMLNVHRGDLDLNGFFIDLGTTGTLIEAWGNTVKGSSGVILTRRPINRPNRLNVAGLGAEITTSANLGWTEIRRGHAVQANGGIARYFDITPQYNTRLNATLTFHYDASELGNGQESTLRLQRSTDGGASWTNQGGTVDETANTITRTRIYAFSRWTAVSEGSRPLRPRLTSFEATVDGSDAVLTWNVASEVKSTGFEVEQKTESGVWERVSFVEEQRPTENPQTYIHRMAGLVPGLHVFRLKHISPDGTVSYSDEVDVTVEVPGTYALTAPYPNPFNPETQFTLSVAQAQRVQVAVYDVLGRRVALLYDGHLDADRIHPFRFDGSTLSSGLYLIRATGDQFATVRTVNLVK